MPVTVYNFNLRVNGSGGAVRCTDKQQAQELYESVASGLASGGEFVEIKSGEDVHQIRAKEISSFGIAANIEFTQEEIKEQQIERIRSGGYEGYPTQGCANSGLIGGNILGKY